MSGPPCRFRPGPGVLTHRRGHLFRKVDYLDVTRGVNFPRLISRVATREHRGPDRRCRSGRHPRPRSPQQRDHVPTEVRRLPPSSRRSESEPSPPLAPSGHRALGEAKVGPLAPLRSLRSLRVAARGETRGRHMLSVGRWLRRLPAQTACATSERESAAAVLVALSAAEATTPQDPNMPRTRSTISACSLSDGTGTGKALSRDRLRPW